MALRSKLNTALALTLFFATISANAYIVPGGPRPEPVRPAPAPMPPAPAPIPAPLPPGNGGYNPYPGNGGGGYGPGNGGGYQGVERRDIRVMRRVVNETLPLLQLAGLGPRYQGYVVESVVLQARGSDRRTDVSLIINGQRDASVMSPAGVVTLSPRYRAELGQVRTLQLAVNGMVDLDSVTLNLRAPNNGGGGGGWGELQVPLQVSRRMAGNDRLDLTQYIDINRYRGMRIVAIEIEANSVYQVAFLDVQINSFNQGQSLQIGNYVQRYTVKIGRAHV